MPGIGMGIGLWKSSGGAVTPASIFGSSLIVDYDPRYEYALNGGNLSALGNAASASSAYDLSTAGASNQPPYNASDAGIAGKPSIGNFDGSADTLRNLSANPHSGRSACTSIWVIKTSTPASDQIVACSDTATRAFNLVSLSTGNLIHSLGATQYGQHARGSNGWIIVERVFDGAGATNADRLKVWVNGVAQTLSFTGTIPATVPVSTEFYIGSFGATGLYYSGSLARGIVANGSDLTKAAACRRLLGSTYGITVS